MKKLKKQVKETKTKVEDLYIDYEPDGRDLAEHLASQEQWVADNPDIDIEDMADYQGELQSDIERGK